MRFFFSFVFTLPDWFRILALLCRQMHSYRIFFLLSFRYRSPQTQCVLWHSTPRLPIVQKHCSFHCFARWLRPRAVARRFASSAPFTMPSGGGASIMPRQKLAPSASTDLTVHYIRFWNFAAQQRPRILEHPADAIAAREEPLTLNCKAIGRPSPEIQWYHNGIPLVPSERRVVLPEGSLFFLR